MTLVKIGFDQLVEFLVCWGVLRCVVVESIPAKKEKKKKKKQKFDENISFGLLKESQLCGLSESLLDSDFEGQASGVIDFARIFNIIGRKPNFFLCGEKLFSASIYSCQPFSWIFLEESTSRNGCIDGMLYE